MTEQVSTTSDGSTVYLTRAANAVALAKNKQVHRWEKLPGEDQLQLNVIDPVSWNPEDQVIIPRNRSRGSGGGGQHSGSGSRKGVPAGVDGSDSEADEEAGAPDGGGEDEEPESSVSHSRDGSVNAGREDAQEDSQHAGIQSHGHSVAAGGDVVVNGGPSPGRGGYQNSRKSPSQLQTQQQALRFSLGGIEHPLCLSLAAPLGPSSLGENGDQGLPSDEGRAIDGGAPKREGAETPTPDPHATLQDGSHVRANLSSQNLSSQNLNSQPGKAAQPQQQRQSSVLLPFSIDDLDTPVRPSGMHQRSAGRPSVISGPPVPRGGRALDGEVRGTAAAVTGPGKGLRDTVSAAGEASPGGGLNSAAQAPVSEGCGKGKRQVAEKGFLFTTDLTLKQLDQNVNNSCTHSTLTFLVSCFVVRSVVTDPLLLSGWVIAISLGPLWEKTESL